jgi:hypothetical protein
MLVCCGSNLHTAGVPAAQHRSAHQQCGCLRVTSPRSLRTAWPTCRSCKQPCFQQTRWVCTSSCLACCRRQGVGQSTTGCGNRRRSFVVHACIDGCMSCISCSEYTHVARRENTSSFHLHTMSTAPTKVLRFALSAICFILQRVMRGYCALFSTYQAQLMHVLDVLSTPKSMVNNATHMDGRCHEP